MPEITQAELNQFQRYQGLGTPSEVEKKIKDLETDNHTQREEIRVTKEKLPKDGQVIVAKADADLITTYKELGEPKELKKKLTEGETAVNGLKIASLRTAAQKFVKAVGLSEDAVETIIAIPALMDATFEVRKGKVKDAKGVEVDGEIGYITLSGKDERAMPFTDAQEKIPALKGLAAASATTVRPTGVPMLPLSGPKPPGAGETPLQALQREARERQSGKKKDADKDTSANKSVEDRLHMGRP